MSLLPFLHPHSHRASSLSICAPTCLFSLVSVSYHSAKDQQWVAGNTCQVSACVYTQRRHGKARNLEWQEGNKPQIYRKDIAGCHYKSGFFVFVFSYLSITRDKLAFVQRNNSFYSQPLRGWLWVYIFVELPHEGDTGRISPRATMTKSVAAVLSQSSLLMRNLLSHDPRFSHWGGLGQLLCPVTLAGEKATEFHLPS